MGEHLNNKHTIFGRLAGGADILKELEKLETDDTDRPKKEVRITRVEVFKNPFPDAMKDEVKVEKKEIEWGAEDAMKHHRLRKSDEIGKYVAMEKDTTKKQKALAPSATLSHDQLDLLGPQNAAPKTVRTNFDFS